MYDSDKLEELRDRAGNIGKPIQEVLIKDICRRIRKTGAITSAAEYQIYRAEALGLAEKELKAAIAKELNAAENAIDILFQDLANETVMFEKNKQLHQLIKGYSKITKQAVADNFKNIWLPAPDGKLYTVKQAYAKIIDFAFFETASGTYDFNTSVRQATKELIKRGVHTIPRDNKGSLRIEYAVRSYITNRMGELHNEISQMNFDKIGANGWEITAHAAPAPDHAPYQGRQYSVKEFEQLCKPLKRQFGQYGCMHLLFPIKVGISPSANSDAKLQKYLDDNSKGVSYKGQQMTLYEAKQQRNSFESLISSQKHEMLAAAGDDKWTQEMQIKLGRMRQEYAYFCKETNQKMRPDKIYVGGFGKSEASMASWSYRKQLNAVSNKINISDTVTKLEKEQIQKELSLIPNKHKDLAEKYILNIGIAKGSDRSTYNRRTHELLISDTAEKGAVIHEVAHALEKALKLNKDAKYISVRNNGLLNLKKADIIEDTETFAVPVFRIKHSKFISEYQGVLNESVGIINDDKVELNALLEYFSEGYTEYVLNPQRLKELDPSLFDYLEDLL